MFQISFHFDDVYSRSTGNKYTTLLWDAVWLTDKFLNIDINNRIMTYQKLADIVIACEEEAKRIVSDYRTSHTNVADLVEDLTYDDDLMNENLYIENMDFSGIDGEKVRKSFNTLQNTKTNKKVCFLLGVYLYLQQYRTFFHDDEATPFAHDLIIEHSKLLVEKLLEIGVTFRTCREHGYPISTAEGNIEYDEYMSFLSEYHKKDKTAITSSGVLERIDIPLSDIEYNKYFTFLSDFFEQELIAHLVIKFEIRLEEKRNFKKFYERIVEIGTGKPAEKETYI